MQQRLPIWLTVFICAVFFANSQTNFQREKYFSFGLNFGMIGWAPTSVQANNSVHFKRMANFGVGSLSDANGNHSINTIANTSIGVHFGFEWKDLKTKNFTGFFFDFSKNKACYSFSAPFSYSFKGDTTKNWVEADNYLKLAIGFLRTWHFFKANANNDDSWYLKASYGQTFNHTNFGVTQNKNYQENWTENGTGMKLNVIQANKASGMITTEIGKRFILDGNNIIDFGIMYNAPLLNTRTITYEFFSQNISLGKSQITYYGSTIMLNLTYTYHYKLKNKPVDSTKIKTFDNLAVDSAEIKHHEARFHHHKINGRRFEVQQSLTVTNNEIKILVWDKNRVDGDEISLYLNGEAVLENYTVSKIKKEIAIKLQPGVNIIVMHALNLGRVPPNTAAISVDDGTKKRIITLVSDLHKSGALEIIYNP